MKQDNKYKLALIGIITLGVVASFGAVNAFLGPSQPGGSGSGALGVDGYNNISIGTSTPLSGTRLSVVASSSLSSQYALRIINPSGGSLLDVRNDGVVGIAQAIPSGSSTSSFIVGGDALINGSITADAFVGALSGSLNASNISAGVFGSGNFAFPSSLGVATTTQVGLPATLAVYGSGYFSGAVTMPYSTPAVRLNMPQDSAIKIGAAYISSGSNSNLAHFATNAWYDGSAGTWHTLDVGALVQLAGEDIYFWKHDAGGNFTLNMQIGGDGTVTFGNGAGKINVGTIDPIYTIGDKKYATYLPAMTGVKEETSGVMNCEFFGDYCELEIDFRKLPEGSDMWLFSKATDIEKHFEEMTVLLSPSFNGRVWYEKNRGELKLVIKAILDFGTSDTNREAMGEISYRFTAPRFDAQSWPNTTNDEGSGFIIKK